MRGIARDQFVVSLIALIVLATGNPVMAAELPDGVFLMADGSYYEPSTGRKAASLEELGVEVTVETTEASEQATPEETRYFRMADGRFFHPGTGLLAATEEELNALLGSRGIQTPSVYPPFNKGETEGAPALSAAFRAQNELKAAVANDRAEATEERIVKDEDFWREVTLAVWNRRTDALRYVRGRKKGRQLILNGESGISVRRSNYINSEYATDNPDELVIAVRYPIAYAIAGVKNQYELRDEVYTPYARDLHTDEIVAEGEKYLDGVVGAAMESMRSRGIASAVAPELVKSLIVIEHANAGELARDAESAIERVYVTLALNRGDAYNYSRSPAGAFGLVQFMPKTYASFVKRTYLNLKPNFEDGMRDHTNAVAAEIAYLDDALANLPEEARAAGTSDPKVQEYLAASYNGGYARVRTAIKIWDEQISGALKPAEILKRSRLKAETIQYVKKLRSVQSYITQ